MPRAAALQKGGALIAPAGSRGQLPPGHDGDRGDGHRHVEKGRDDHGGDDPERHGPLRVLALFRHVQRVLEADEGEEGENGAL